MAMGDTNADNLFKVSFLLEFSVAYFVSFRTYQYIIVHLLS
jgi:hypothetical protein